MVGVIKDISSILTYGEMSTSYKHATLLALFDYIAEQPSEAAANNFHFLPLVDLARQFVAHYWCTTAFCAMSITKHVGGRPRPSAALGG
jgi:hypothetical protein